MASQVKTRGETPRKTASRSKLFCGTNGRNDFLVVREDDTRGAEGVCVGTQSSIEYPIQPSEDNLKELQR